MCLTFACLLQFLERDVLNINCLEADFFAQVQSAGVPHLLLTVAIQSSNGSSLLIGDSLFLQNVARFHEVIPIPDEDVRGKIHITFRLAYVRDVALPRALDDLTLAALHSMMMFNYMEILQARLCTHRLCLELGMLLSNLWSC